LHSYWFLAPGQINPKTGATLSQLSPPELVFIKKIDIKIASKPTVKPLYVMTSKWATYIGVLYEDGWVILK
jgi:hypothetical protein